MHARTLHRIGKSPGDVALTARRALALIVRQLARSRNRQEQE
jgi:hypothetical protein